MKLIYLISRIFLEPGLLKFSGQLCIYLFTYIFSSFSSMTKPRETIEVEETLLIRMCAVHRLPPEWDFDEYKIILQVYHGSRPIAEPLHTIFQTKTKSFYDRIVFDSWLESKLTKIFVLPRESRIVLTLFSRHMVTFTFICLYLFVYIFFVNFR